MTQVVPKSNSAVEVSFLFEQLEEVEAHISDFEKKKKEIIDTVKSLYEIRIAGAYKEKGESFGAVSFKDTGLKLTFTTPKKVEYNQEGLAILYAEGAPVDVEYNIKEVVFKDLDKAGKEAIIPYRTVKSGKMTIKIERE